ncbi:methionyl-tRNA formyltransferase [Lishizhenia tianjinensis]|uniref:Methionyl-tRNA formyltransferase n=1 Tax=Lishizhenia tianjinensis TaxID=477690 RepID=A0A1I6XSF0_9FLAO|nr:methionyl-tRNA formyltransferase [Lishizhenia tianjinensis]SFT40963.1 methionyl-tRNA formyltransferase [Lishizhenia tianjinensis]
MKKLNIVFMGTPEFAVTILDTLYKSTEVNVVACITAPDKPAGRGQKINQSAVKQYTLEHDIPCLQPTNLKDENFIGNLKAINADLFVVVAFRMLPEVVWSMPPKGTINLHGSLLPQYRGAAPINWAVINGEKETGVTTFFIEKEIDTGMVIEREAIAIGENETAGELHDRLMHLGAKLTLQSVLKISSGEFEAIDQSQLTEEELKPAPKIFKPDCAINFDWDVQQIHNFVRGMSPYPTAWFTMHNTKADNNKTFKVFKTTLHSSKANEVPALIELDGKLILALRTGSLEIHEIQMEGKKRLTAQQFMQGYRPEEWEITL